METELMENYKSYPKYKDSNVEWIGKIPFNWEVLRIGSMFFERREKVSDKDFKPLSVTKNGVVPQLENAAKSNDGDNRKGVRKGDFVINSRSDRKGSSGIAFEDGSVSLINIAMKPKGIVPKYSEYLLKSYNFIEEFYRHGHGIVADLWTTRYSDMKGMLIPVPSKSEQITIAKFLDKKTKEIKEFIALKEKTIELLKERKTAIINQAVTKGLDPSVKMKDTGIEWLGEIPEHWEIHKIGFVTKKVSIKGVQQPTLLSVEREKGIILRSDSIGNHNIIPNDLSGYKLVKKGNLVLNKMKTWQGSLGVSSYEGVVSPAYIVLEINATFDIQFMHHLLRCKSYVNEYNRISYGVRPDQWDMHFEDFKQIPILIPSENEQRKIVEHIELKFIEIENSISQLIQEINLIKEYRQSLISEAVTGKIDVRGEVW